MPPQGLKQKPHADAVEMYLRQGWCPIPTKYRSKEPNLAELAPYLSRRATEEELSSWSWTGGVGIVTGRLSGILVLDVDGPEGETVLREQGHPITPMVRTGGGGLHLYFRHPDADVRTGIRVKPGLDVKAAGGYVVAPPSVGPTGAPYEWIIGPEEAETADVPDWLMHIIARPQRNGGAGPVGETIPNGQRNRELASLAGSMRHRGMGEEEIFAALAATNRTRCVPPLDEEEVRKIAGSVARYKPGGAGGPPSPNGRGAPGPAQRFNLTDLGNAERLVARHGESIRYCHPWGKWLTYDGRRWKVDGAGRVRRLARETVRQIGGEAPETSDDAERKTLLKWALASEAKAKIDAMLGLAEAERGIPVEPEELDRGRWILNVENGTIDLRTGELQNHRRGDLITRLAPVEYNPNAEAPTWRAFLERVLPSQELRRFVQRAVGYSLTGDTSERVLLILHGAGRNGKSTLLEALREVLGDYGMQTPAETLLAKASGGIPNDVARLKGARFVSASETEAGRRLAEALVKQMTGNDSISARFMRAEWFDFKPTHKTWLATNHKPEIRGTDHAIWDRVRLVPFEVRIPAGEVDRKLPEKLRAELPGILTWAVRGCLQWQREGLGEPEEVRAATAEYRAEMDVLAGFVKERCVVQPTAWTKFADLYTAYAEWCEESRERPENKRAFGARLAERGFEGTNGAKNVAIRRGIGLRQDREPDPGGRMVNPEGERVNKEAGKTNPGNRRKIQETEGSVNQGESKSGTNSRNLSHGDSTQNLINHVNPINPNAPDGDDDPGPSGPSGPKNDISGSNPAHEGVICNQGPKGPKGPEAADDEPPDLAAFLADPPRWWLTQAAVIAREGFPGRLVQALARSTSTEVYGTAHRWSEVLPAVQGRLERWEEGRG